jgi:hypothetical protein
MMDDVWRLSAGGDGNFHWQLFFTQDEECLAVAVEELHKAHIRYTKRINTIAKRTNKEINEFHESLRKNEHIN